MTEVLVLPRRRALALAMPALLAGRAARAQAIPGPSLLCRVIRNGQNIGTANYQFIQDAGVLTVRIAIDLHIKLGFVTLFNYVHRNVETWQGGALTGFTSTTNNNGSPQFATARRTAGGLAVTGSHTAPYTAPPHAIGSSYWNPLTLTAPLINSQTGRLLVLSIRDTGLSSALLSNGSKVAATEYQVTGDMHLNIWYDASPQWAGQQYYAHDGSILTYEKT